MSPVLLFAGLDAVRSGRPPMPGPIDALRTERLTAGTAHALRTGLRVELDLDADPATGRDAAEVSA